jgi:Tfp pilus assembly protein PilF
MAPEAFSSVCDWSSSFVAMLAAKFVVAASMTLSLAAQTVPEDMASHAQAAHEAEQRGDFSTAAHEYQFLVQKLPRSAEMQSNLGVALYFDHQWEPAIAVFRKAITLNKDLLAPHLFTGLAWYQLSQPDAAVPQLETAVRLRSSDVIAHTWLGYAYVAQSRYDDAAKQFEEVCRIAPDNVDAWYALGQAYLQIGKESTLELLQAAPNGGRTWQLAGEQFQLQGDRKKALQDFEQANARRPDIAELRAKVTEMGGQAATATVSPNAKTSREDALYTQAHTAEEKSRAAFEHVLSIAPDSYRAHQIMAYSLVTQQQYDKAIAEYRLILNAKPDLPGVHEAIGNSLLHGGNTEEALQEFEAELKLQPHSASANTNLGQVLVLMGKDDAAETVLTDALKMDRPPSEVYRLLAKVDLHRKDYRSAVSNLTRYLSMKKNDATAYYLLSRAYRGLGEKEEMNQALNQFEKLSQDVKARSQAQGELERLDDQNHVDEGMVRSGPESSNP